MVFHTIHVIFTPLFIFHHFSFCLFYALHHNFDSPLFSFCPLVSGISFLLSKGDHISLFLNFFFSFFKLEIKEQKKYITIIFEYSNYLMRRNMIYWHNLHLQTHAKPEEKPAVATEVAAVAKPTGPVVNILRMAPRIVLSLHWEDIWSSLGKKIEN